MGYIVLAWRICHHCTTTEWRWCIRIPWQEYIVWDYLAQSTCSPYTADIILCHQFHVLVIEHSYRCFECNIHGSRKAFECQSNVDCTFHSLLFFPRWMHGKFIRFPTLWNICCLLMLWLDKLFNWKCSDVLFSRIYHQGSLVFHRCSRSYFAFVDVFYGWCHVVEVPWMALIAK